MAASKTWSPPDVHVGRLIHLLVHFQAQPSQTIFPRKDRAFVGSFHREGYHRDHVRHHVLLGLEGSIVLSKLQEARGGPFGIEHSLQVLVGLTERWGEINGPNN